MDGEGVVMRGRGRERGTDRGGKRDSHRERVRARGGKRKIQMKDSEGGEKN